MAIYVNGTLEENASTGHDLCIGTLPLSIGRSGEWHDGYLNGALDDVKIYDAILTADQVKSLYDLEK
jgi:hypothetical protein